MWTDIGGDQQRCERHGETFRKGKCCAACVSDPGPPPELVQVEVTDTASVGDEQWCRDQRDMLIAVARDAGGRSTSARSPRPPAEPGADGDERDGWFWWRGHWRPVDPTTDAPSPATIAKLADTALKFHRAAVDERRRRGEHDHERWLVRECRKLQRGRGGSN